MSPEPVPKPPRVYLHVGAPKTGTTFLQGVLWKNPDALKQQGVWLPGTEPNDHFRAGFDLFGLKQEANDPRERWAGAWDAMAAKIRESDSDVVVVSDERLAAATVEQVERAVASLAPAEVHVIYTTRGLTELFPAEWQEHIKDRDTRTFDAWLSDTTADEKGEQWFWQAHDVADVLRRWGSAVQAERLHVLTLPPPGSPPNLLWERFTSVLGIDPNGVDTDVRANASLGAEGAQILRRVNEALPPNFPVWHRVLLTREVLAHRILASRKDKTRITLPANWAQWVQEYTERLVTHLKSQNFHIVGNLNELMPGDEAFEQAEGADPSAVLDTATDSIAGLLVHLSGKQDRDALLARAEKAEELLREHRQMAPVDRIKRTVVELGDQWKPVHSALGVWRKAKSLRK